MNTSLELAELLGEQVVTQYHVIQNNPLDQSTQVCIGKISSNHDIWINRCLMECDVKILTGFIEPHFFAGYSGGGKAVMPGMAGLNTILNNHNAKNIGNPKATWGVTYGNPIFEEILEVIKKVDKTFLVNVALNRKKQITGIFTGECEETHAKGCSFVKESSMVPVDGTFEIAITTNSGYPADINLYQAVKGMSAASQVIGEGGTIIIASECRDGIPGYGQYGTLLRETITPQDILERIQSTEAVIYDQWQAQIQAMIQKKSLVSVFSHYLTDEQIQSALQLPCRNIEDAVQ